MGLGRDLRLGLTAGLFQATTTSLLALKGVIASSVGVAPTALGFVMPAGLVVALGADLWLARADRRGARTVMLVLAVAAIAGLELLGLASWLPGLGRDDVAIGSVWAGALLATATSRYGNMSATRHTRALGQHLRLRVAGTQRAWQIVGGFTPLLAIAAVVAFAGEPWGLVLGAYGVVLALALSRVEGRARPDADERRSDVRRHRRPAAQSRGGDTVARSEGSGPRRPAAEFARLFRDGPLLTAAFGALLARAFVAVVVFGLPDVLRAGGYRTSSILLVTGSPVLAAPLVYLIARVAPRTELAPGPSGLPRRRGRLSGVVPVFAAATLVAAAGVGARLRPVGYLVLLGLAVVLTELWKHVAELVAMTQADHDAQPGTEWRRQSVKNLGGNTGWIIGAALAPLGVGHTLAWGVALLAGAAIAWAVQAWWFARWAPHTTDSDAGSNGIAAAREENRRAHTWRASVLTWLGGAAIGVAFAACYWPAVVLGAVVAILGRGAAAFSAWTFAGFMAGHLALFAIGGRVRQRMAWTILQGILLYGLGLTALALALRLPSPAIVGGGFLVGVGAAAATLLQAMVARRVDELSGHGAGDAAVGRSTQILCVVLVATSYAIGSVAPLGAGSLALCFLVAAGIVVGLGVVLWPLLGKDVPRSAPLERWWREARSMAQDRPVRRTVLLTALGAATLAPAESLIGLVVSWHGYGPKWAGVATLAVLSGAVLSSPWVRFSRKRPVLADTIAALGTAAGAYVWLAVSGGKWWLIGAPLAFLLLDGCASASWVRAVVAARGSDPRRLAAMTVVRFGLKAAAAAVATAFATSGERVVAGVAATSATLLVIQLTAGLAMQRRRRRAPLAVERPPARRRRVCAAVPLRAQVRRHRTRAGARR